MSETIGSAYIFIYLYDETGSPIGIKFRRANYAAGVYDYFFFEKNLQGDIVAIYNESGAKVATYTYDAWGKVTTTYVSTNSIERYVANNNPFRYRGYYYDLETGLYYLQSRYYNPTWGRFINSDNSDIITATPDQLTDKNLYAYCDNNPITRMDDGGEFWNFVIGAGVGAIIGGVVSAVSQLKENPEAWKTGDFWAHVGVDAAVGAVNGTICASGLGIVSQAGLNGVTSGLGDIAHQAIDNNGLSDVDVSQSLKVAATSMATSVVCSGIANKFTKGIDRYANNQLNNASRSMLKAMGRMDAGRSYSAIMRQTTKFLHNYNTAMNIKQGASSVIGTLYGSVVQPCISNFW